MCTYGSDFYYFLTCAQSSSNLNQLIYKIGLSWLTGQTGEGASSSTLFLEIEMSDPVCWGKCPDYGYSWVNFSLKMQFQEYLSEKTPDFFPIRPFVCLLQLKCFLEQKSRSIEVFSVQKTGCMPGRPPWLADKSKEMFGFWTSQNIHFFNDFKLSNLCCSHDTQNFHTQIYINSNTIVHIFCYQPDK